MRETAYPDFAALHPGYGLRPRAPDAAQHAALAEWCAAEPGPRLLSTFEKSRNRGPGSAVHHFALHRARDTKLSTNSHPFAPAEAGTQRRIAKSNVVQC